MGAHPFLSTRSWAEAQVKGEKGHIVDNLSPLRQCVHSWNLRKRGSELMLRTDGWVTWEPKHDFSIVEP